jgi:hypothetical protein
MENYWQIPTPDRFRLETTAALEDHWQIPMPDHFRFRLETREPTAALIALLRRHTGKAMNELRVAILDQQPFLDERPHHNEYTDFGRRVTDLLNDLEARDVRYAVEVDGKKVRPQDLRNVFQRWRRRYIDIEWMDTLDSGDPIDIETLEWLKQNASRDKFRSELRRIVRGGCALDQDAAAWARRERDLILQDLWTAATESGGNVDIDMLEWLKQSASVEVYRATLEQIVQGDRHTCDKATMAWARHELE